MQLPQRRNLFLPIVNGEKSKVHGELHVVANLPGNVTNIKPEATIFTRTPPAIPTGMVQVHKEAKLHLDINVILTFAPHDTGATPQDTAAKRDAICTMVQAAKPLLINQLQQFSIKADVSDAFIKVVDVPVSFDFHLEPVVSLLRDHGRDGAVNVIWATRDPNRPVPEKGAGQSGASPGVKGSDLADRTYCSVVVKLDRPRVLSDASFLASNAAHEICHYLGLTHESAGGVVGNLMCDDTANRGATLNEKQLWIIQNSVMVEERAELAEGDRYIRGVELYVSI